MSAAKPEKVFPIPTNAVGWFLTLRREFPAWYKASSRIMAHAKPWPERFDPQKDSVFSYNEIMIPQFPPPIVFEVLVSAKKWPEFYPNANEIRILSNSGKLEADTEFRWKTFATEQKSKVELFEQNVALGWSAESPGTHAFHRWILEPFNSGTRLITEECQNGITAWLDRFLMNPSLHAAHQLWLERLKSYVSSTKENVL